MGFGFWGVHDLFFGPEIFTIFFTTSQVPNLLLPPKKDWKNPAFSLTHRMGGLYGMDDIGYVDEVLLRVDCVFFFFRQILDPDIFFSPGTPNNQFFMVVSLG